MKRGICWCLLREASCELLRLPLLLLLAVAAAVLAIGAERWLLLLLMPLPLMRLPITDYLLRDKQCLFPASRQAQPLLRGRQHVCTIRAGSISVRLMAAAGVDEVRSLCFRRPTRGRRWCCRIEDFARLGPL